MQRRPGSSGRQKRVTGGGGNTFRRGEGLSKGSPRSSSGISAKGTGSLFKKLFSAKTK